MGPEELRVRSLYVFLSCAQTIEEFKRRLAATLADQTPPVQRVFETTVKRELGLLFRCWVTRQVWERLESRELDAKNLNLALLRLFFEGLRLPKDGSGLRYAELSTVQEELVELSHRLTNALGSEHQPLLKELRAAMLPWRDAVATYTLEALELPLRELSVRVQALVKQVPGDGARPAG